MKYSLAFISLVAAMVAAAPIEQLSTRNHITQGTPFCAGRDHCVYLGKHAFTYLVDPKSPGSNKNVICESYDNNGHGRGACQFPNKVATTIQCDYTGDIMYAKFGCHKSSFKFHKQTKMTGLWSSEKAQGHSAQTTDGETTSVGDDLYIRCHAGKHHEEQKQPSSNDNYGNGGSSTSSNDNYGKEPKETTYYPAHHSSGSVTKDNYGSGSASGSGSIHGSGSITKDIHGGPASGSIGGSVQGSGSIGGSYNQGLPNVQ